MSNLRGPERAKYMQEYAAKNKERIFEQRRAREKITPYYSKCSDERKTKIKNATEARRTELRKTLEGQNKLREADFKTSYGITFSDYMTLLIVQNYSCAICGAAHSEESKYKRLSVDHCHTTNKVRGLLCRKCNFGLGHFNDNTKLLEAAMNYLGST
jgi:hypothetical protein